MRRHSSFLLRCWEMGGESERIEVEHIQSGTKVLAKSVADAVEWICARDGTAAPQEPASGQAGAETGNHRQRGGSG
ncbi:hypothetical protein BH24CHL1_BH24CHL1_04430 [soil metagenome]